MASTASAARSTDASTTETVSTTADAGNTSATTCTTGPVTTSNLGPAPVPTASPAPVPTAGPTANPAPHSPTGPAAAPPALVPLRRNWRFQLLWGGAASAMLGTCIADTAYPLLLLAMTGSPSLAGAFGAVQFTVSSCSASTAARSPTATTAAGSS